MNKSGHTFVQMALFQLRDLYRNKIAFFFNLVFPLIWLVLFSTLFGPSDTPAAIAVGVVNVDEGGASGRLVGILESIDSYEIVHGTEAGMQQALTDGKVRAVVGIPDNVGAAPAPGIVDITYDPLSPASARAASELRTIIDGVGMQLQGVEPVLVSRMQTAPGVERRDIFDYLMPGQLTLMLLSAGMFSISVAIAGQRQTGMMRHLFSTPLSVGVWTGARIGSTLLMSFVQGVLLFAFAALLYNVVPPENVPATVFTVIVSSLACLGMGLVIGLSVKGEEAALAVTMPVFMTMIFLGNVTMPLEDPPAIIATLMPFTPTFHMTEALRAVMREGQPLAAVSGELTVLGGVALATFAVALWRLRRQYAAV